MSGLLGKLPPADDPRTLRMAKYRVEALKPASKQFGFGEIVPDWGMLGNDQWGDCVLASGGHQTMLFTRVRHGATPASFSDKATLRDYSAITGFDPNAGPSGQNPTDNGTVVLDALKYRVKTGLLDANGKRHKIAAYASFDAKDWDLMTSAAEEFGIVEIGFEFPSTAFSQFDRNVYWDYDPRATIEGGHDVCIVGSRDSSKRVTCITWGRRQQLTRGFYEAYNDEAWVPLSEEMIRSDGTGLHGYDWAKFESDLAAI